MGRAVGAGGLTRFAAADPRTDDIRRGRWAAYGYDKPELRLRTIEITDLHRLLRGHPVTGPSITPSRSCRMEGGASKARRQLDAWPDWAKNSGDRGLAYVLGSRDGTSRRFL